LANVLLQYLFMSKLFAKVWVFRYLFKINC